MQLKEINTEIELKQILSVARDALDSSSIHLEKARKALADELIFENVDMNSFKKFESELLTINQDESTPEYSPRTASIEVFEHTFDFDEQNDFSHS